MCERERGETADMRERGEMVDMREREERLLT